MANYYSEPPRSYDRPERNPWAATLWPLVLMVGLVLILLFWQLPRGRPVREDNTEPRPVAARGDLAQDEKSTIDLFKKASPSVVHITTLALRQNIFTLDVFQIPQGTGSGFIWDSDGNIVTNFHVIQAAVQDHGAAKVTLSDHSTYDAQSVGIYPDKDLAVLRVNAPKEKLRPIPLGTSRDLQVGQKAFAIGNPFGLDQTLTTGIISALGRSIKSVTNREIKEVIQTDAAINPGNSGGPLLDSAGRLIGVNTAIYSPSGTSAGIGFAIPVDEVNRAVPQLIRSGKVIRPSLGIEPAEDQLMRKLDMEGVLILYVAPDGPAAKAGLRPTRRDRFGEIQLGDIITAIDGKPIKSKDELYAALEQHQVGDTVTVTVQRDDERHDEQVMLGATSQQ
jgi:S1-C subfamily serine protease